MVEQAEPRQAKEYKILMLENLFVILVLDSLFIYLNPDVGERV
jgi:hypothetical protein